jgi:hypothetical protein
VREFRDVVVGNESIALYLGPLVERAGARSDREGTVDDLDLVDALGRARELHDDLRVIVARLEQRLDGRKR